MSGNLFSPSGQAESLHLHGEGKRHSESDRERESFDFAAENEIVYLLGGNGLCVG